jgi:GAF domain-containing protein
MTNSDLSSQLKGLFADAVPESDARAGDDDELLLKETIAGLLEEQPGAEATATTPRAVGFSPEVPGGTKEKSRGSEDTQELPRSLPGQSPPGEGHTRTLSILLRGAMIVGGALLIFLLIRFAWPKASTEPRLHILYFAAYALAIAITLIQWLLNSSLTKVLRKAENGQAEALQSQTVAEGRADELATANALLQKRVFQLQSAVSIGAKLTPMMELKQLAQQAVNMIREQLDLYYVGLFLVDEADADIADVDVRRQASNIKRQTSADSAPSEWRGPREREVGEGHADIDGQWAVLQAGTGEAGRQMLAQGHRLELSDASTVGWCIASGQACIGPDPDVCIRRIVPSSDLADLPMEYLNEDRVQVQRTFAVRPLLPETRSQVALPLRSRVGGRDRVIGALDIHSTERDAFSQEDAALLQAIADQTAIAIGNARLFAETRKKPEEVETRYRRHTHQKWGDSVSSDGRLLSAVAPGYERIQPDVAPLAQSTASEDGESLKQAIEQAMTRQEIVVQTATGNGTGQAALVAPISLRGEVLGALGLHDTGESRQWTDDEVTLIEAIADQMALAIENARLLKETEQWAERERLSADITARVRASTEVDTILRTAIRELSQALGASDGVIRLCATGMAPSEGELCATRMARHQNGASEGGLCDSNEGLFEAQGNEEYEDAKA